MSQWVMRSAGGPGQPRGYARWLSRVGLLAATCLSSAVIAVPSAMAAPMEVTALDQQCGVASQSTAPTTAESPPASPFDTTVQQCQAVAAITSSGPREDGADEPSPQQVPPPSTAPPGVSTSAPLDQFSDAGNPPAGAEAIIAGVTVPEGPVAIPDGFTTGSVVLRAADDEWAQTGWIAGEHCGQTTPTLFTEFGSGGSYVDQCWTSSFPLTPGQTYYFSITDDGPSWTTWLYWNQAWYALGTSAVSAVAKPGVTTCAAKCIDPLGTAEGAGSTGLIVCGVLFEACVPGATIAGLYLGVLSTLQGLFGNEVHTCTSAAVDPNPSGSTVTFGSFVRCQQTLYAISGNLYARANQKAYAASGTTCNFCATQYIQFSTHASHYIEYQGELTYIANYTASSGPSEYEDRYSGFQCECF